MSFVVVGPSDAGFFSSLRNEGKSGDLPLQGGSPGLEKRTLIRLQKMILLSLSLLSLFNHFQNLVLRLH